MKTKCAIYIRVSTADQATFGYSLAAQRLLLESWADDHNYSVYDVYADEGKSASKSLEKRTELLRLLDDAERGLFSLVIFKDVTRWSRSSQSYYKVQERLDKCKVGWVAVEQPYLETITPTGRFQTSIMLGTAQLEAEQTGQRIRFVQDAEVRRGHYPFPPHCCPTGYTTERRDDGNYLVIDKETAPIIRTVYGAFKRSFNLQRCVDAVKVAHGITYSETSIARFLRNPIYKGEFRGIRDFCEPIVSPQEWDGLQRPKKLYTAGKHRGEYFFSGIAKCGVCGATLRASCPEDRYHLYTCRNGCGICIEQGKLERKVLDQIEPQLSDYRVIVKKRNADEKKNATERKKIVEKKKRLNELYIDGVIDKADFENRRKAFDDQLEELRPVAPLPDLEADFVIMYKKLNAEKKVAFWRAVVDHITVDREKNVSIAFNTTKVLAERMAMFKNTQEIEG